MKPLSSACRRGLASLIVLGALLAAPAASDAQESPSPGYVPSNQYTRAEPPPTARLTVDQAGRIASRDSEVQAVANRHGGLEFVTAFNPPRTWLVDFFRLGDFKGSTSLVRVEVDDLTGTVVGAWTGWSLEWQMARGREGQFGHKLNAPYVWIPLCVIFLLGLLDWRRPFRIVHLDLVALLAFGASHYFLGVPNIELSVPLAYPVLAYLLARMLWIGFRGGGLGLRPSIPITWLAVAAIVLLGARVGLNVGNSGVLDVGYAGVIGADRISSGESIWAEPFPSDNPFGDTYGPVNYLAYVPFEMAFPWSGKWDDLPAAHAVAIFFDLATVAGLFMLGRRLRPGRDGEALGTIMAFAWAAYPYTAFALQSNTNDSLVSALIVWSLVAFMRPAARGALLALAGMTKFAPLVLAPLFAAGERGLLDRLGDGWRGSLSRLRPVAWFTAAFVAVIAAMLAYVAIDAGLATFWERTLESQIERESPFSIWGQHDSLELLHTLTKALVAGLAVLIAFVPRRRTLPQIAALGAAVMIALQITVEHWFYLYIPWFLPLLLAALAAGGQPGGGGDAESPVEPASGVMPR